MAVNVEELKDTAKGKRRKIVAAAITLSIVVHAIIGVGALYWIIARFFPPPEATFVSRPVIDQKIASVREAKFALPDIPKVPVDMLEFDPTSLVSDQVSDVTSMMRGRGNSAAGMMGVEFFGLKATGQYIAFPRGQLRPRLLRRTRLARRRGRQRETVGPQGQQQLAHQGPR
jgi:hypothetical protein